MAEQNEEHVSLALRIRLFFRELFGSRLIQTLERELERAKIEKEGSLLFLRKDYEARMQDKDVMIASLRTDLAVLQAKVIMYEQTLLPHASRQGADLVKLSSRPEKPNFKDLKMIAGEGQYMTRWQRVQADWDKQQEEEEKAEAAQSNAATQ